MAGRYVGACLGPAEGRLRSRAEHPSPPKSADADSFRRGGPGRGAGRDRPPSLVRPQPDKAIRNPVTETIGHASRLHQPMGKPNGPCTGRGRSCWRVGAGARTLDLTDVDYNVRLLTHRSHGEVIPAAVWSPVRRNREDYGGPTAPLSVCQPRTESDPGSRMLPRLAVLDNRRDTSLDSPSEEYW